LVKEPLITLDETYKREMIILTNILLKTKVKT